MYSAVASSTSARLRQGPRRLIRKAGIGHWHALAGRHTAISITSSSGVPIQEISDTVGHKSTHVTETAYRDVNAPAIHGGEAGMGHVFGYASLTTECPPHLPSALPDNN